MTREEIVEGLKLLEDNMVYFDELQNDKGEWIDVHELLFEAIKALSQEPCADAVSRDALLGETIRKNSIWNSITNSEGKNLEEIIFELPSVTHKSGKWIDINGIYAECSSCNEEIYITGDFKYCPNCGAKMESEE